MFSRVALFHGQDLAIDPALLRGEPLIPDAMVGAHFALREERPGVKESGIWELGFDRPTVDLLVPRSLRPVGRRGARLGIHGNQAGKTVPGLEGALVDRDRLTIRALVPGDRRRFRLRVAGPAALLVMKAYKIGEHLDEGRPVEDKDAYDVAPPRSAARSGTLKSLELLPCFRVHAQPQKIDVGSRTTSTSMAPTSSEGSA